MTRFLSVACLMLGLLVQGAPAHPHDPKALRIELKGGGVVTLDHITVPFNAEHLKSIKPGFIWHCGFAKLKTPVALSTASGTVPPGTYLLRVKNLEAGKWSYLLIPEDLDKVKKRLERLKKREGDAMGEELEDIKGELASLEKKKALMVPVELPAALTEVEKSEEHLLLQLDPPADAPKDEKPSGFQVQLRFGKLKALGTLSLGPDAATPPNKG
jgi:hypothetical protein